MNEINLLRYHDRSAREVHMLLNGELADEFFTRVVLAGKRYKKAGAAKKHPALAFFFTMLLALMCALGASYFIYTKYLVVLMPASQTSMIPEPIREVMKMPEKAVEKVKPDPLVMNGYSNIGDIELGGSTGTKETIIVSDYTKPKESTENKPEEIIKPITVPGEPMKRIPDAQPEFMPVYSGTFMIQFFNADPQETKYISALATKNDMKLTKIAERSRMVTHWNAYYIDKKSKTRLAGYGVRFIQSFNSRAEAKTFLKNKGIRGFVAAITAPEPINDWGVCCAKEDAADKMARASGVDMNKVKIIKIKE